MGQRDDPVGSMAKLMAKLFAFMSAEIIKQCGEEKGKEIIQAAVREFGVYRGGLRKEATLAAGKPLTLENFEKFGDLPPNEAWEEESVIQGNVLKELTRYCPFAEAWRELNMEELGSLYCEIDRALCEGYFDKVQFERPSLFSSSEDGTCSMVVTVSE